MPKRPRRDPTSSWAIREQNAYETLVYWAAEKAVLEVCEEAWKDHKYVPAVMDALHICVAKGLPLPEWLATIVVRGLDALFSKEPIKRTVEARVARVEKQLHRGRLVEKLRGQPTPEGRRRTLASAIREVAEMVGEEPPTIRTAHKRLAEYERQYLGHYRPAQKSPKKSLISEPRN